MSTLLTDSAHRAKAAYAAWRIEEKAMIDRIDKLTDQLSGDLRAHPPNSLRAADQLLQLRSHLRQHFDREEALGRMLASARGATTLEIDAVCRQADSQHRCLMERLGMLIESLLDGVEHPTDWEPVLEEWSLFGDAFEQHEERQQESIAWLLPKTTAGTAVQSPETDALKSRSTSPKPHPKKE